MENLWLLLAAVCALGLIRIWRKQEPLSGGGWEPHQPFFRGQPYMRRRMADGWERRPMTSEEEIEWFGYSAW